MTPKTLWSETLLEMLFVSLRKNRGDREVRQLLRELRSKGYRRDELLIQTDQRLGHTAMGRVKRLSI